MGLSPGRSLGPYRILGTLGAGGMGEVYRARDTSLDRDVAIKILPEQFANDEDRLARFTREAKALAALNHPNIAAIHSVEESDGIRGLVMELCEGPTLAERLRSGALPLSDVLAVAIQIADALDAAHSEGIVHRDLKPANIKLRPDGSVKVVDFGLAKLDRLTASSDPAHSPTVTAATQAGVLLGTAAYMSPEQARGKAVDKRADYGHSAASCTRCSPRVSPSAATRQRRRLRRSSSATWTGRNCRRKHRQPSDACCAAAWKRIPRRRLRDAADAHWSWSTRSRVTSLESR